jgi:heme-degrading monooxygenase HmoA
VIVEIGIFRIDGSRADAFAPITDDIRRAFASKPINGLRSFRMAPTVEDATRWSVLVSWDSLADHERFVASAEGRRQRLLLEGFMLGEPDVFHLELDAATEGVL